MRKSGLSLAVALLVCGGSAFAQEDTNTIKDTLKLGEITVVSATGFEQNIVDAPASISVVTKEQLEKKSYENFNQVVQDVPGVFLDNTIASGGNLNVRIRGMDKQYTKILIDGKPSTSSPLYFNNEIPPLNIIERVEVIRGPMSSLYNSDALGGMINIITKKVPNEWTGNLDTQYLFSRDKKIGDRIETSAYVAGPIIQDILGLQLNGLLSKKDGDTNQRGNMDRKRKNIGAKLVWNVTDRDELSFDYSRIDFKETNNDDDWLRNDDKDMFSLSHKGKYDKLELSSFLKYDKNKFYHFWYSNGALTQYNNLLFQTEGTYFFNKNILTLGYAFEQEQEKLLQAHSGNNLHSLKKWNMSLFAEDDWFVTDDLTLTFGARLNKDEVYGLHFTPRLYANYHLNDNFVLKGGISGGFKNPEIKESSLEPDLTNLNTITHNNPDLKPETSLNYEAGFNFTNNNNIDLNVMAFLTNFKDRIEWAHKCWDSSASYGVPSTYTQCSYNNIYYYEIGTINNIANARTYGVELSLNYNILDNLNLRTNYTYAKSKITKGKDKGDPINENPRHMLNIGVNYQALSTLNLWTQVNYKSKQAKKHWSDNKILGSYTTADLGIVYDFSKNAKIRVGVTNLFDKDINSKDKRRQIDGTRFNLGLNVNF